MDVVFYHKEDAADKFIFRDFILSYNDQKRKAMAHVQGGGLRDVFDDILSIIIAIQHGRE